MVLHTPTSPYYSPYVVHHGDVTPNQHHPFPRTPTTPGYGSSAVVSRNNRSRAGDLDAIPNVPILVCAFCAILATGGPTYSFGVYATTLKHTLNLTQSQLETLGAASFGAGFISWIPGLCVDIWGPKLALIVGGCGQCICFIVYWIISRFLYEKIGNAESATMIVPLLSLLSMMIFTFNNLVIGGVFKSIVISCGLGTKGKAVGAAKAYLGLGSGVFTGIFQSIREYCCENDLDFLLMSSIFTIIAIVLPSILCLPNKYNLEQKGTKDESTNIHYQIIYYGLFILAIVVVGSSVLHMNNNTTTTNEDDNNDNDNEDDSNNLLFPDWIHGIIILLLWIGPILSLLIIPTKTTKHKHEIRRSISVIRRKVRQKNMELLDREGETMRLLGGPPRPRSRPTTTANNNNKNKNNGTINNNNNSNNNNNKPLSSSRLIAPMDTEKQQKYSNSIVKEEESSSSPLDEEEEEDDDNDDIDWNNVCETPKPVDDLTLIEMLQTISAWLFLMASTILVGSGTVLTINMGQMVQSRGMPIESALSCLAIFSVSQALARVAAGAISESALSWKTTIFGLTKGVPRTAFLVLSCGFAVVGHALLAISCTTTTTTATTIENGSNGGGDGGGNDKMVLFVIGITLTGFSFGALWPLMVLIVGDLFGTVNHGANYMFMDGFTCAVGTLSIAKFLTQYFYEKQIDDDSTTTEEGKEDPNNTTVCYGAGCFRTTHMIISGLCLVSLLSCVVLLYMTRSSYGSVLLRRRRAGRTEEEGEGQKK